MTMCLSQINQVLQVCVSVYHYLAVKVGLYLRVTLSKVQSVIIREQVTMLMFVNC